jgi:hypothetical protein
MSASDTSDAFRGWWAAPPGLSPSSQAHCCSRWAGHTPCRPLVLPLTISRHRLRDGSPATTSRPRAPRSRRATMHPTGCVSRAGGLSPSRMAWSCTSPESTQLSGGPCSTSRWATGSRSGALSTIGANVSTTRRSWCSGRPTSGLSATCLMSAAVSRSSGSPPDRSRVELRYAQGPPLRETDVDGGFVILADAMRPLTELVAFDAAGRELGRADVSHIDLSYRCQHEPGCTTP